MNSILILTYNNLLYTRLCLESIEEHTDQSDLEMVVIDNASQDGTPAYLQSYAASHANVRLRLNDTNLGFARGCNQAALMAGGENLIFLNNDTIVTPGWLPGLLRHLDGPQVGMVGPVTNRSANETRILVDYDDGEVSADRQAVLLADIREFSGRLEQAQRGKARQVSMLPFLCAALRRSVFEQTGPLDERFEGGMFEDDDYARRLRENGYHLLCAEDVFVHHWGSAAFSLEGYASYWQTFEQNLERFEAKWGRRWQPHHYRQELQEAQWMDLWEEKRQMARELIQLRQEAAAVRNSLPGTLYQRLLAGRDPGTLARRVDAGLTRFGKQASAALRAVILPWQSRTAGQRIRVRLQAVLAEQVERRPVVVFQPTLPWDTPLFQRPHQLAQALARLGCLVVFMEPSAPAGSGEALRPVQPGLYVLQPGPLLSGYEALPSIASPVVYTLAYHGERPDCFDRPQMVYEMIDDLSVLPGEPDKLAAAHHDLLRDAAVVSATSAQLFESVVAERPDALLLPNAVDYAGFHQMLQEIVTPPPDLERFVRQGRRIIGYYGALAKWLDYPLLAEAARLRPDYQLVLVGPDYDASFQRSHICDLPNVTWSGARPYRALPAYLNYFDAAVIPFKVNPVTQAISPIKMYEYLAAGKPVVATPLRECRQVPGVLLASSPSEFAARLDEALELAAVPGYRAHLQQFAQENSWDARARTILGRLRQSPDA